MSRHRAPLFDTGMSYRILLVVVVGGEDADAAVVPSAEAIIIVTIPSPRWTLARYGFLWAVKL
jgi:hypothetical protein